MTLSINAHRPFFPDVTATGWFGWARKINFVWWLQRLPMALLAIPSAYGVGAFSGEHLPLWVAVIQGLAFEATYLGAVAFADQQDEGDQWTTALWWAVNLGAVLSSVICNLLWVSDNHFTKIAAESFAHAVPMPVLGFLYGLLLHRNNSEAALRAQFTCKDCGASFTSEPALRGHKGRCQARVTVGS